MHYQRRGHSLELNKRKISGLNIAEVSRESGVGVGESKSELVDIFFSIKNKCPREDIVVSMFR